jgi:hypothetical protein
MHIERTIVKTVVITYSSAFSIDTYFSLLDTVFSRILGSGV